MTKPGRIFDRDAEWAGLTRFIRNPRPHATLGVVSGRRRQGKSFLLEALAEAHDGFYFPATESTQAVALREFTEALVTQTGTPIPAPPRDWGEAIALLFHAFRDRPAPVIIDEFPFLIKSTPALPSIIQRELGPGGSGQRSRARLLLCGSAMSVMGGLLAANAPLRGRAGLELIVRPFAYREAAEFWGLTDDPLLAVLVHSVLGGTPAYRREFLGYDAPESLDDFDGWVERTVLNPQSPLFREARYLLAEETEIRDPGIYHSVLAAIADGNATSGRIANHVGRKAPEIAHPLNVLADCGLVVREPDAIHKNRPNYHITEPLITFYQQVMRRNWNRLERGDADRVWRSARPTFMSKVVGPHFEALCRDHALLDGDELFDGTVRDVGTTTISDPDNRSRIELDMVVLGDGADGRGSVLALGEAKVGQRLGEGQLRRLERARDLLGAMGHDVSATRLALYSTTGFSDRLTALPDRLDVRLLTVADLYR